MSFNNLCIYIHIGTQLDMTQFCKQYSFIVKFKYGIFIILNIIYSFRIHYYILGFISYFLVLVMYYL